MVKEAIQRTTHTSDTISILTTRYNLPSPSSHKSLAGGFSGTNYKLNFTSPSTPTHCLKICHGYDLAFVEAQARVMIHYQQHNYKTACFAVPLSNQHATADYKFATIDPTTQDPVILLTFANGRAADALLEEGVVSVAVAFSGMGASLGALHSVPVQDTDNLRTYQDGGACDVYKQMESIELQRMETNQFTQTHPFLTFYKPRRLALESAMRNAQQLTRGVIHGDPFADNVMLDPKTGKVSAWVDWEDATTGPILFDVAVSIIGTCFPEGSSTLDVMRLKWLMSGYTKIRPIPKEEYWVLMEFCRLALLCNCCWRFTNFHIAHREVVECRDRYVELRDRILELEKVDVQKEVLDIFRVVDGCYVVDEPVEVPVLGRQLMLGMVGVLSLVSAVL